MNVSKSLKRENYWIKTLRTIYPYGLNKRASQHDSEATVVKLFFLSLELSNDLPDKEKASIIWKMTLSQSFFTHIDNIIENDVKDSFYKIPLKWNNLKNKIFKLIAPEISHNGNMLDTKINSYFYNYVLDITDTKTYKFKKITPKNI